MILQPPRSPRISWCLVVGWTLFIYLTIPLARVCQETISEKWGRMTFFWFVMGAVLVLAIKIFQFLLNHRSRYTFRNICVMVGVTLLYAFFTWKLKDQSPEEALHLVQYGVLYMLVFRALTHHSKDYGIYFVAILITSFLGNLDEIIQGIIPRRYFGWRDVGLNSLSACLACVLLVGGLRPAYITAKLSPRSIRMLSLASIAHLTISFYAFMSGPTEYGYIYRDPEIGTFKSRFSPSQLRDTDAERGRKVASILNENRNMPYMDFLDKFSSSSDPFIHEVRVHIHSRDKNLDASYRSRTPAVAYFENRVLEKYFTHTLAEYWNPLTAEQKKILKQSVPKDFEFYSKVSQGLFPHSIKKSIIALYIFLLILFSGVFIWKRRKI